MYRLSLYERRTVMKIIVGIIITTGILLTSGIAVFAGNREPDFMENHAEYGIVIEKKGTETDTGNGGDIYGGGNISIDHPDDGDTGNGGDIYGGGNIIIDHPDGGDTGNGGNIYGGGNISV